MLVLRSQHLFKGFVFLTFVLIISVVFTSVVGAQTPIPPAAQVSLTAQANPDPLSAGGEGEITLTLSAGRLPDVECVGIPTFPLDAFLVVDNSASAGIGPGSNIELTQRWLLDWLAQAESVAIPSASSDVPQRIRLGVVASRVATGGTELLWQTLTEDYSQLRSTVDSLAGGGDTALAPGIERAATTLKQRARPNARQALILVLHDRLPLTSETLSTLQTAQQNGIEIFLFVNTLNLNATEAIDATTASFVDVDHFWSDPTLAQRQRALVQMTGGAEGYLAQDILVTAEWLPIGLMAIAGTTGASGNVIQWSVGRLAEQEEVTLTYGVRVSTALATSDVVSSTAQIAYRDCNGVPRVEDVDLSLRIAAPRAAATPIPEVTLPPQEPESTLALPTLEMPTLDLPPTETPPVTPPVFPPIQGPIDQFMIWIMGLIPSFSTALTPLLGLLPVIIQWLLILLLVLLLLFLLWRLFKMLKGLWRRKKPEPLEPRGPILPPPPPPPASSTLPQWIPALPGNVLLPDSGGMRAVATATPHPLQNTLLIGLGAAGREVLAQVAAGLNDRFGKKWPENIRVLQIDVLPADVSASLNPPRGLASEQWALLRPSYREIAATLQAAPKAFAHWQWYESIADEGRARGRMAFFNDVKDGSANSVLWRALTRTLAGLQAPVIRIIGTTFDDVSSGMLVDMVRLAQLAATGTTDGTVDAQLWLAGPTGRDWGERLGERGKIRSDEQISRTLATLRELERFQRNAPVEFLYVSETNRQDLFRATRRFAVINKIVMFEPKVSPPIAPDSDALACMADTLLSLLNQEVNTLWNQHVDSTTATMGALANQEGQGAVLALGNHALRYPGAALAQTMAWRMVRDALFETAIGLAPMETLDPGTGAYQPLPEGEQGQPLKSVPGPRPEDLDKLVYDYKGYWDGPAFAAAVRTRVNALLNGEAGSSEPLVARRAGLAQAIRWLKLLRAVLLQNDALDIAHKVQALEKDLLAWQRWLKEEVYPLCQQQFQTARDELARLQTQPARGWGLDATLEWNLYRQRIRSWDIQPHGSAQSEPLLRLTARFGWEVQHLAQGWRPRLIIPPGEFDEQVEMRTIELLRPYELTLPGAAKTTLLSDLFSLAERAVSVDAPASLLELALTQDAPVWWERAEPRVGFNSNLAGKRMRQVDLLTLLVAPESAGQTVQLAQNIENIPDKKGKFAVGTTNDPTAINLLRATSWLPLSALHAYGEEAWNNNPVPPTAYVWCPEQIAAELEHGRRLSASLVSRIAENELLLRAFGLAFLYQLVTQDARGWRIPGMLEPVPGTLATALDAVFAGDAKAQAAQLLYLQTTVEQRRESTADRRAYLKKVETEYIKPLESGDARAQDLAIYLRGLIVDEGRR